MKTLFDLITQHKDMAAKLLLDDELTDEQCEAIATIEGGIEDKCSARWAVAKSFEMEAEVLRAQAKELLAMAQKRESRSESLKRGTVRLLDMGGISEVKTDLGRFKVQESSKPTIRWTGDMDNLPDSFSRVKIELDGGKAFDAFKAGTLPAGFEVKRSRHIRVY